MRCFKNAHETFRSYTVQDETRVPLPPMICVRKHKHLGRAISMRAFVLATLRACVHVRFSPVAGLTLANFSLDARLFRVLSHATN